MAAIAAPALLATAAPAGAAEQPGVPVIGPLAISPETGDLETPITFTSGGGCPGGTAIIVRIYGAGFPEIGENVVGNSETFEYGSPPADRMVIPMTITLDEAVKRQPGSVILDGKYRVNAICRDSIPEADGYEHGDYVGHLSIDDETFTALTTAEDLPTPPTPKTGRDARENPLLAQYGLPFDPEQQALAAVESVTGRPAKEGTGNPVALGLTAAGLVGALGLLYVVGRGRNAERQR